MTSVEKCSMFYVSPFPRSGGRKRSFRKSKANLQGSRAPYPHYLAPSSTATLTKHLKQNEVFYEPNATAWEG